MTNGESLKTTLESVFPSFGRNIGLALSPAQQDHERK